MLCSSSSACLSDSSPACLSWALMRSLPLHLATRSQPAVSAVEQSAWVLIWTGDHPLSGGRVTACRNPAPSSRGLSSASTMAHASSVRVCESSSLSARRGSNLDRLAEASPPAVILADSSAFVAHSLARACNAAASSLPISIASTRRFGPSNLAPLMAPIVGGMGKCWKRTRETVKTAS